MKRKEILNVLSNEDFDEVYINLDKFFGEEIDEQIYILPNIPKVREIARDLHFTVKEEGSYWFIVELSSDAKANITLYNILDENQLLPFFGHYYKFGDFINK